MGVRILLDRDSNEAVMYCSSSDWAFGPLVSRSEALDKDADERLEAFIKWSPLDPRTLSETELQAAWSKWTGGAEEEFYARDRLAVLEYDEASDLLMPHDATELATLRTRFR